MASTARYFYNRLRRRLAEEDALKRLATADPSLSREARMEIITQAIAGDLDLENDSAVAVALEKGKGNIATLVKQTRAQAIGDSIASMAEEDKAGVVEGIKKMLGEKLNSDDLAVRLACFDLLRRREPLADLLVSLDLDSFALSLDASRFSRIPIDSLAVLPSLFLPLMYRTHRHCPRLRVTPFAQRNAMIHDFQYTSSSTASETTTTLFTKRADVLQIPSTFTPADFRSFGASNHTGLLLSA